MSYVGAETAMIDLWIASKLAATTALDTLHPGLTGKVFNRIAPSGTGYPFIIFQPQSDPEVVRGVGDAEVMVTTLYLVKAIAQGSDFSTLAPVASAIRTALVVPNGVTVTGGAIFTSRYENQFTMVEHEATKQYRHLGGIFRIQAQATP